MELYTFPGAISPARVVFFLTEKGLKIPTKTVNLMVGEHKTPEYRNVAINGRVPALVLDDGSTLCESMAICRYLEGLQPQPALLGSSVEEAARIEMWNRMIEFEVMLPMAMAFRHTNPAMKILEDQMPDYGEKQRTIANKRLQRLERQIEGRDYIAGDAFSVADITAWCSLKFFRLAGFEVTTDWPNLLAWFRRITQRPAAAAAFR